MNLKFGLYEQLVNILLRNELNRLEPDQFIVQTETIDAAEAHIVLSRYLQKVMQHAFQCVTGKNRLERQIQLCNRIVGVLNAFSDDPSINQSIIPEKADILLSIFRHACLPPDINPLPVIRPLTRLSQSSLFTGSMKEPSLASEIKKEILSADRIDILMSFVKWSGLRIISDALLAFTAKSGSRLRLITTTYIGATDIQSLDFLMNLPNTEIRVSLDSKRTRLHAKAYLFARDSGFTTAYIGSSNISNPALTSGLEWNIKVTAADAFEIIEKFQGTFETYWNDNDFLIYTPSVRDEVMQALQLGKNPVPAQSYAFDIQPYPYQIEILDKLLAERQIHGKYRNLVVSATGTGKTVVAAFDFKRFRKQNPFARFLFIAHRKEILEQSIACFRVVLGDQNFGDLYVGNYSPAAVDHLFMSIQTFHAAEFWLHTPPEFYDYIIIDEFHHAEAVTYRTLLEYYQPQILLGLTATPERMDAGDILRNFDNRIAAEIRLYEAINRKLLAPFHYFGISDCVDLSKISWSKGGYSVAELKNVFTGNDIRVRLIRDAILKVIPDTENIIGLGFCVSISHAEYMATAFNRIGIPSEFLTGKADDTRRSTVQDQLKNGRIKFVFVVDLYNEGVDIPEINTVMFLRPTESLTVFLQQLGKGPRIHDGKECLTVLDFIGQSNKNYQFEERYRALMGRTANSTQKEIENDFPHLPSGCVIQLEKKAREHILDNIRQAVTSLRRSALVNRIANYHADTDKKLTFANFLETYQLSPYDIYRKKTGWSVLCAEAGVIEDFSDPDAAALAKGIARLLHVNSPRYIEFMLGVIRGEFKADPADPIQRLMMLMFHYILWQESLSGMGLGFLNDSVRKIRQNRYMVKELCDVLEYNYQHIQYVPQPVEFGFPCPLDLHCRYARDEILAVFGLVTEDQRVEFREGVKYIPSIKTDIFLITLYKSEHEYSPTTMYQDYAVSNTLFHWQSQSTTSDTSPTGQRYINHQKTGNTILLFVREYKKERDFTSPYIFLGSANYVRHEGSRPMSILWKLTHPMPAHLWKEAGSLAVMG